MSMEGNQLSILKGAQSMKITLGNNVTHLETQELRDVITGQTAEVFSIRSPVCDV